MGKLDGKVATLKAHWTRIPPSSDGSKIREPRSGQHFLLRQLDVMRAARPRERRSARDGSDSVRYRQLLDVGRSSDALIVARGGPVPASLLRPHDRLAGADRAGGADFLRQRQTATALKRLESTHRI